MAFDVKLRGQVVLQRHHTLWVQCPDCGPQPPALQWDASRERWTAQPQVELPFFSPLPRTLTCGACGADAPYRKAAIPQNGTGKRERCGPRCLNGKSQCSCACEGRCHGEGVCYCGPTPAPPDIERLEGVKT